MAQQPRPFDPRRPFSRADARRGKLALRELLGPKYHKLFFDCYVAAEIPLTTELRAGAALDISPTGSWVSHSTAARLWSGVVPDDSDVHVTVPKQDDKGRGRTVRRGVRAHVAASEVETTRLKRLLITTPEQTFLDMAGSGLDLVALVTLGDSLVGQKRTTPAALLLAAQGWSGVGAKRARRAAGYVRAGVDSPKETALRMLLVLAGLSEPEVNLTVRHGDGSWKMRFDLSYPELKLIIEYDGRQHADSSRQWVRDLARREELDARGWRIIVVTGDDLFAHPGEVLRRVREAMLARGATGLRRERTAWMPFFAAA